MTKDLQYIPTIISIDQFTMYFRVWALQEQFNPTSHTWFSHTNRVVALVLSFCLSAK